MIENAALISVSKASSTRRAELHSGRPPPKNLVGRVSKFASANDVILGRSPLGLPLTGANREDGNVLLRSYTRYDKLCVLLFFHAF